MTTDDDRPLVVFDLDGVITRHDTMAAVVRERLFAAPWRLLRAVPAFLLLLATDRWPVVRQHPARWLVRIALLGYSADSGRALLAAAGAELAAQDGWLHADALAAVRSHQRSGDRVVVATASVRQLAESLLAGDVRVLGSELAPGRGGPRLAPHNYRGRKVAALRAAGFAGEPETVYSDSLADLPLLARTRRPALVNAGARAHRVCARRLPRAPLALRWD